jgi:hypothetical protein
MSCVRLFHGLPGFGADARIVVAGELPAVRILGPPELRAALGLVGKWHGNQRSILRMTGTQQETIKDIVYCRCRGVSVLRSSR